ncbi:hypothetical protein JRI60_16970 [Archangium violaceum]|uniref:hypothetical protein n=1 Tax=Archangium violaceum TaxID=83451 RepID=UPI00195251D5|nr:hypothetical protein [Archangium violaceum]QRO00599.1 hypothetical protein JRI60_16970 [Archangium violaceum]
MRASIFGGLLATALMVVGCGAPVEQEEAADLSTLESPIPDCANSPDSLYTYYSDATYTTQIGIRGCSCGWWYSSGRTSAYSLYTPEC